jgi:hypothetical protein
VLPAGFAGCINLTVTLPTMLGLAERPGELSGLGPVDPALARDLARAAARNPKTRYCVTVTDEQGHAIGHGCARPAPRLAVMIRPAVMPRPAIMIRRGSPSPPPAIRGPWRVRFLAAVHRDPGAAGPDHRARPDRPADV